MGMSEDTPALDRAQGSLVQVMDDLDQQFEVVQQTISKRMGEAMPTTQGADNGRRSKESRDSISE